MARGVYVGAQQSASGSGTQATVQIDLAKGLKLEATAGVRLELGDRQPRAPRTRRAWG